ncbi:hypothetical protein GCM10008018_58470 [Paenibacillus marchantiophytorum]|uniref:Uncharacterized protein n=1 Tax=Paenibacillus marchantiophytorum TaxID=1619310 RepID=A0ABQ1FAS8_9BACL|nr:DUF1634 domain-containing protein [Paenibacillus marchantiophytorum]GGA04899.1 hypothetical protein GCM10008018_58470 [Paenibacillus marchantiophytorum]
MENISIGLKWAIGVIVTLLIIAAGVGIYFVANGYFNRAHEQTMSQSQMLSQAEFSTYDNKDVTGQDVIDAATKYAGRPQFSIHVNTGVNGKTTGSGFFSKNNYDICYATPPSSGEQVQVSSYTCSGKQITLSQMQDATKSDNYINPTGIFASNIFRDANSEVRLIEFKQK